MEQSHTRAVGAGVLAVDGLGDAARHPLAPAMRDGMVSVVYFFDRVPESQMGGATSSTW